MLIMPTARTAAAAAAPPPTLRSAANNFSNRMRQLTVPYLMGGYYPTHSLTVAAACLVVSLSLLSCSSSSSSTGTAASGLLFNSLTSYAAATVVATMACTALYRVLVLDNVNASTHSGGSAAQQSDWIVDVLIKGTLHWVASVLLEGPMDRRVALVLGVSAAAEMGNLFGSTAAVTAVLSLAWVGFLVSRHYLPKCLARCG